MNSKFHPLSKDETFHLQAHLLDYVDQAILAVDIEGHVVFWNRGSEKAFAWTATKVIGRPIDQLLEAPELKVTIQDHSGRLAQERDWSGQYFIHRFDGVGVTMHLGFSLIVCGPRVMIGIVALSTDSSEHYQLQEANRLLSEAGTLLSNTLGYEESLRTLAQLAVPQVADWCVVHLRKADGSIEQVALAPVDARRARPFDVWLETQLPNDEVNGLPAVFRSGQAKLVVSVASDHSAAEAAIQSYLIVPLVAHPQIIGSITFVTAESGRKLDTAAVTVAENLASHIAVYLDKARQFRQSQDLNVELERRVDERTAELQATARRLRESEATIQTLFRISNNLNSTLDIELILDELAQEAIRIVDGDSGLAGLCTAAGMTSSKYYRRGRPVPFKYSWASGQGVPGWVLLNKKTYLTNEAENDPLVEHQLTLNAGVQSMICTPIINSVGLVLGYFDIRNKKSGQGFTAEDQDRLLSLAPSASIAIQNALAFQQRLADVVELKEASKQLQALAANLESAREEERLNIARDLHDELGQALTAMKFDLAWLGSRLAKKDTVLATKAKDVTEQMDLMIKTVRRIATELRPGMLDDLGLIASIEWLARDFEKNTGILCSVIVTEEGSFDGSMSAQAALTAYRIFQEATTNIARHSGAKNVIIDLTATAKDFVLSIQDDGRGISNHQIRDRKTLGLLGMQERANRLGGSVSISGSPNNGTLVTVTLPMEKN